MYECTLGVGCLKETVLCVNPEGAHHDVFASDGATLALVFDFLAPVTLPTPTPFAAVSVSVSLPRDVVMPSSLENQRYQDHGSFMFVSVVLFFVAAAVIVARALARVKRY